ncbi:MAG: LysE family translocator [bacterium]|nr:LysE family translocator [bacterium]
MEQNLPALLLFTTSAAFTPGPNNLMITASGANFGYRRSLPHMMGVTFGFPAMLVAMAFGLVQIFDAWPVLHTYLRYAGATYMVYLAFRIATSTTIDKARETAQPLSFMEAALFQWINPKAVIYALSTLSIFTTPKGHFFEEILLLTIVAVLVSFASITTWCMFGTAIGHLLKSAKALLVFNLTMAATLLASITLIFR